MVAQLANRYICGLHNYLAYIMQGTLQSGQRRDRAHIAQGLSDFMSYQLDLFRL